MEVQDAAGAVLQDSDRLSIPSNSDIVDATVPSQVLVLVEADLVASEGDFDSVADAGTNLECENNRLTSNAEAQAPQQTALTMDHFHMLLSALNHHSQQINAQFQHFHVSQNEKFETLQSSQDSLKASQDEKFERIIESQQSLKLDLEQKLQDQHIQLTGEIHKQNQVVKEELRLITERMNAISKTCEQNSVDFNNKFTEQLKVIQRVESNLSDEIKSVESKHDRTVKDLEEFKIQHSVAMSEFSSKVETVGTKIGQVEEKVEKLEINLEQKFQAQSEATETLIENKVHNIEKRVGHEVARVSSKVIALGENMSQLESTVQQTVVDIRKEVGGEVTVIKKGFQDIRDEMSQLKAEAVDPIVYREVNSGIIRQPVILPPDISFSGNSSENPPEFLRRVENQFAAIGKMSSEAKCRAVTPAFKGAAADWLQALPVWPMPWDEFRSRFLVRYWSREKQFSVKKRILQGRYDNSNSLTMQQYCEAKLSKLRCLEPPMEEVEIIYELTLHFHPTVQNLLKVQNCKSLEQFVFCLGQIDDTNAVTGFPGRNSQQNNGGNNNNNQNRERNNGYQGNNDRSRNDNYNNSPNDGRNDRDGRNNRYHDSRERRDDANGRGDDGRATDRPPNQYQQ